MGKLSATLVCAQPTYGIGLCACCGAWSYAIQNWIAACVVWVCVCLRERVAKPSEESRYSLMWIFFTLSHIANEICVNGRIIKKMLTQCKMQQNIFELKKKPQKVFISLFSSKRKTIREEFSYNRFQKKLEFKWKF